MDEKRVRIRSYNKVWTIENRIYAFQNIVLPIPIVPKELLYYSVTIGIMLLLGSIIPIFGKIPWPIKFLIIPIGISRYLLKKKLDGKAPQKYFVAYIKYLFKKNDYIERFGVHTTKENEKIKLNWVCSKG